MPDLSTHHRIPVLQSKHRLALHHNRTQPVLAAGQRPAWAGAVCGLRLHRGRVRWPRTFAGFEFVRERIPATPAKRLTKFGHHMHLRVCVVVARKPPVSNLAPRPERIYPRVSQRVAGGGPWGRWQRKL